MDRISQISIKDFSIAKLLSVVVAGAILSSCGVASEPHLKRIKWSPDGKQGLLFSSDNSIKVIDERGTISGEAKNCIDSADWLPDGKGFVATTVREMKWDDLKEKLSKSEQQKLYEAAKLCERLVTAGKTIATLTEAEGEEWNSKTNDIEASEFNLYLSSVNRDVYNKWVEADPLDQSETIAFIEGLRLFRLMPASIQPGPIFYESLGHIESLAVSPNGHQVAVVDSKVTQNRLMLVSLPPQTGKPLVINESVSANSAWCPDKKSLLFLEKNKSTSEGSAGSLTMATITDQNGQVLKKPTTKVLTKTGFVDTARVQCLGDGTVIFSAVENAPNLIGEKQQKLFKLSLGVAPNAVRIVPDLFQVSGNCNLFHTAPDGKHIAVLEADGTVDVLDNVKGTTAKAQPDKFTEAQFNQSAFIPQWRSSDQLSFCAPVRQIRHEKSLGAAVLLWSLSQKPTVELSQNWPPEVASFLDRLE